MSSVMDTSVWKLPVISKEMEEKHLKEEIRRLKEQLSKGAFGCGLTEKERRPLQEMIREKELELANPIVYMCAELKAAEMTRKDYHSLMCNTGGWVNAMTTIFGIKKTRDESVYDVLSRCKAVTWQYTKQRIESIEQTQEEYIKSLEIRRFWCEQLETLKLQEEREMQKVSSDVILSTREIERFKKYIEEDQQECFIVQACETMKSMLDTVVRCVRVRSVGSAFERVMRDRNSTIDDDLPTDEEKD